MKSNAVEDAVYEMIDLLCGDAFAVRAQEIAQTRQSSAVLQQHVDDYGDDFDDEAEKVDGKNADWHEERSRDVRIRSSRCSGSDGRC